MVLQAASYFASGDLPKVTLVIPCHNEEAVIQAKLENV